MIRLSRILSLTLPARLSQEEIDALPKIVFEKKSNGNASVLLAEKCPICLTEFDDQERINKLHCSHLFHLQCISTWLSVRDFRTLSFLSQIHLRLDFRKTIHVQHVVVKSWVIN